jgi:drug/metabolite transporter (DMT)-like permease
VSVTSLPAIRSSPGRAIACMTIAVALFTIMDGFIKWLGSAGYPTMQLVFFRSLFAFLPLSVVLFRGPWRQQLVTRKPWAHLLRCLAGLTAMAGFFYSYSVMPLADAIAIGFAAPIFITALSVPLLGEKVGIRRWTACLVGFGGVLVIVQPGPGLLESGALFALGATVCYAVAAISVRRLARSDSNVAIVFYFTLCTTVVSAGFMPWQWVTPDWIDLGLLILLGLLGGTAQLFMTEAFRQGEVGLIMPFEYTAMIWSVGIGYFVWQEIPGLAVWLGSALVIASGLYIVYRETYLRRAR